MPYGGKKSRLKTVLVLSGGGSLGAFEIGALKVLLPLITPHVIIGTSVGALNGACIALDFPLETMEEYWLQATKKSIFPLNKKILFSLHHAPSFYSPLNLEAWVKKIVQGRTFAQCKIPLYINATRLRDGKSVFFHQKELLPAVMASTALPPLFPPHIIEEEKYIDGGLSDFLGTEEALALRCKQIIIVNLMYNGRSEHYEKGLLALSQHLIQLLAYQAVQKEIELCRYSRMRTITIPLRTKIHITDFSRTPKLIEEGRKVAKSVLRKIII